MVICGNDTLISILLTIFQIFCLDGDGAALMHMGNMSTVGQEEPKNFKHIILNNGAHDSVGGQPTFAADGKFSFTDIAKACGYTSVSMRTCLQDYFHKWMHNCKEDTTIENTIENIFLEKIYEKANDLKSIRGKCAICTLPQDLSLIEHF